MRLRHTPQEKTKNKKPYFRAPFATFWRSVSSLTLMGLIFTSVFLWFFSKGLPTFDQLENYTPELASKVYSTDGKMIKEFYTQKRFYTPLSQIPQILQDAVLATEDHRFHKHWGIIPSRTLMVTLQYLLTGSKAQGASTITQQLARQLYLTLDKTVTRKVKEIFTALQLERTYTKPEILEMYMNHMLFGHGTYGVESAARHYFNKNLSDLTIAECALLTGMLQRPASYHPYRYPERAIGRRNIVLGRMLEQKVISQEEYDISIQEELALTPRNENDDEMGAYFTEEIRRDLQDKYSWDLYKGGLKIYTTLDTRLQAAAERTVRKLLPARQAVVNRIMRRRGNFARLVPPSLLRQKSLDQIMVNKALVDSLINEKCKVQVALVALEPSTGHILAMIGGRSFLESEFNRATQAVRQPGSIFKPIVYTAAVDNGYMPYYEKLNQPIVVDMWDGSRWTPHNYDGSIGGKTPLREALRRSLNLVTARLVQEDVPPHRVVEYARRLGITTRLDPVDAIALGSSGVIPLEIISAFGVFANKGVLAQPTYVLRVEDKYGNILEKSQIKSKGVLKEETAYIMASLLQTVASRGTGASARSVYKFSRPAGGKTGTTNDFTDAWYVTFTPQMVAGVWVGLDDPSLSLGNKQSGARAALPITATFVKAAHDTLQLPVKYFEKPDGVIELDICMDTKKLATESCPNVIREIADVVHAPSEKCPLHTGERKKNDLRQNQQKRRLRF
jgi:penicillin-binding protein 1A